MLGDYTDSAATPRWPFGFGRSYTTLEYSDLSVQPPTVSEPAVVRCIVPNTGSRATDEVVQFYARDLGARVARPIRQLVGFLRVPLQPGDSRTIECVVHPTQFAYYDEAMDLVIEPGDIEFTVGPNASEQPLRARVSMIGTERSIGPNDRRPSAVSVT